MEIAENTDEQKKDLPGMDLDTIFSELERVLANPSESYALAQLKEIAEYNPDLEELVRVSFKKAARCELTEEDLDKVMKVSEEVFLADMDSRHPQILLLSCMIILAFMLLGANTGLLDTPDLKISGDAMNTLMASFGVTAVLGGAIHLQHKSGVLGKERYHEEKAAAVGQALVDLFREAKRNAALTGIPLDNLIEDIGSLSYNDLVKRIGESKLKEIHAEF